MVLSIQQFQAHAAKGGNLNVVGSGPQKQIVNSQTSWLGRAIAWLKSRIASDADKAAEARRNRAAMDAFIVAMQDEFGIETSNRVFQNLGIDLNASKPLTARMVRDAIAAATDERTRIARFNHTTQMRYSPFGPTFQRMLDDLPQPVLETNLTDAQKKLIDGLMIDEVNRLADGNHNLANEADVKEAFATVVAHVVSIGNDGATAVLEAERALTDRIREFTSGITNGQLNDADAFCDTLLRAKRLAEDLAALQGRQINGAEDMVMLLVRPIQRSLRDFDTATLERVRAALTDPQGMAVAFMQGVQHINSEDTAIGLAFQRSEALLDTLLLQTGIYLHRDAGHIQEDTNKLHEPTVASEQRVQDIARHLELRLTPWTYDPRTADIGQVLRNGEMPELRAEIFEHLRRNFAGENADYFIELDTLKTEPTIDLLRRFVDERIKGLNPEVMQVNISNQQRTEVDQRLQALIRRQNGEGENPPITNVEDLRTEILRVLEPATNEMVNLVGTNVGFPGLKARKITLFEQHLAMRTQL